MLTIQYINPTPASVRLYGDTSGRVFLDVDEAFDVRLTKAMDQLDEYEQVTQEAALSGSLTATYKNRFLLEQFRADVVERNPDRIQIEVIQDGERLPLSGASVLSYDNGAYEFEMYGDDWLDLLGDTVLRDVDLGTFEFTVANVEAAWGNRQTLALPGVAHYGDWFDDDNVVMEDLRFVFNLGLLMKKVFCHVGWTFESPHFDYGDMKYAFSYLSAENWHWYDGKEDLRWVHVNIASPRTGADTNDIITFDEVYDPFDLYNNIARPDLYLYGALTQDIIDLRIQVRDLTITLPPSPAGEPAYSFIITIFKDDNGSLKFLDARSFIGSTDQNVTHVISYDYIDEDTTGGDAYGIAFSYTNLGQGDDEFLEYTIESGDVYFRPDPPRYHEGDVIPLGDLLSDKITGKDLFEAMAHLCNGKIVTNYAQKKVTLYAADDYLRIEDNAKVEGFFQKNKLPIDLRPYTTKDGVSFEVQDRERERYRVYGFADSTDEYLQNDSIFTRRVDLGSGLPKDKEIRNPLFEPTGEIFAEDVGGNGVRMPAMWDNTDGNLSHKIGPRIFIYYGDIEQTDGSWSWEGSPRTNFPYLAQVSTIELPVDFIPISYNGYVRDIFTMHYKREVLSCVNAIAYKLIITNGNLNYSKIDFRRTILITDEDSDLEMQPTAVRDYVAGSRVPMLVEARLK